MCVYVVIMSIINVVLITLCFVQSFFVCVDGSDFVFVPHNITFPSGSIINTFSIIIQDDILFEMNETFNVTLLTFPSSRLVSIANGTITVVIVDNDRKC